MDIHPVKKLPKVDLSELQQRWYIPYTRRARLELDFRTCSTVFATAVFKRLPQAVRLDVLAHCLCIWVNATPTRGQLSAMGRSYSAHSQLKPYVRHDKYHESDDGSCHGVGNMLSLDVHGRIRRRWSRYADTGQTHTFVRPPGSTRIASLIQQFPAKYV
jgi:hypothetical protein